MHPRVRQLVDAFSDALGGLVEHLLHLLERRHLRRPRKTISNTQHRWQDN